MVSDNAPVCNEDGRGTELFVSLKGVGYGTAGEAVFHMEGGGWGVGGHGAPG